MGFCLAPASSRANIIFTQSPVTTDVNVLDLTPTPGSTVMAVGRANSTSTNVINVTTNTARVTPAAGQARVEAASSTALFTTVVFTPIAGMGFSVLEINPPIFTPQGAQGTFTLTATDQFGLSFTSSTLTLGNGDNRVAAVAQGNERITRLTLTASGPIVADVRQIRLTSQPIPNAVPEPATFGMAAVAGLFGLGYTWRSRSRATN